MHKLGIVHRDIKLANLVQATNDENDSRIKIVDMGFAKFLEPIQEENEFCGSPQYMAPESLLKEARYNHKVDIWATGITLFKLLNGDNEIYTPYKNVYDLNDLQELAIKMQKEKYYEIKNNQFRDNR